MSPPPSPSNPPRVALLDDPTRRLICAILSSADPPRTERDLAVELAARTDGIPPRAVSHEQRRRRQLQLYHHQLPKLAAHGLLSYNRSRRTVSITSAGRTALTAVADGRLTPAV